jgi:hypothetical protein
MIRTLLRFPQTYMGRSPALPARNLAIFPKREPARRPISVRQMESDFS